MGQVWRLQRVCPLFSVLDQLRSNCTVRANMATCTSVTMARKFHITKLIYVYRWEFRFCGLFYYLFAYVVLFLFVPLACLSMYV